LHKKLIEKRHIWPQKNSTKASNAELCKKYVCISQENKSGANSRTKLKNQPLRHLVTIILSKSKSATEKKSKNVITQKNNNVMAICSKCYGTYLDFLPF